MPISDGIFRPPIVGRVYPPTKRPDGTWRKPVKIRKGWRGDLDYGSDDEGNRMLRTVEPREDLRNINRRQYNIYSDLSKNPVNISLSHNLQLTLQNVLSNLLVFCKYFFGITISHCIFWFMYIQFIHTSSFYGYLTLFLFIICYFLMLIISALVFFITKYLILEN